MRIVMIEDETLVAKTLARQIQQIEPDAQVEGPLTSVAEAVNWLRETPEPDLILSDIQLSDGVSFDIFRQVTLRCPIIFTTAYDEYAIRAFKLNSIDYLLKPIEQEELQAAFAKYYRWRGQGVTTDFREQLRDLLVDVRSDARPRFKQRFTAHYRRQVIPVPVDQVACFVRDELIYLHTLDGSRLVTDYHSLDELEDLTDPATFFRANRQHLLSVHAIAGYQSHYTGKLIVSVRPPLELELTISKEKAAQFRDWFEAG